MMVRKFLGINNVVDETRLKQGEMTRATNVVIGAGGELRSREGREQVIAGNAHSVFEVAEGVLAVIDSDLVLLSTEGTLLRTIYPSLGYTRVWYLTLPSGKTAFSNGLINGLIGEGEAEPWGIPVPVSAGAGVAGSTLYQVTYVRDADGLEGAPIFGDTLIDPAQDIIGLPVLAGHTVNVYFAPYGEAMFLAGSTATDTFVPTGGELGPQFIGSGLAPPPVGTQMTEWRTRALIADGATLWATRPLQPDLCDLTRDFIQLTAPITLLYGTDKGVFVGTTKDLQFLSGETFGDLKQSAVAVGPVALGSVVEIDLALVNEDARPQGELHGALCLVNGSVHLLTGNGQVSGITAETYRTDHTEVFATARLRNGVLQYIVAPV